MRGVLVLALGLTLTALNGLAGALPLNVYEFVGVGTWTSTTSEGSVCSLPFAFEVNHFGEGWGLTGSYYGFAHVGALTGLEDAVCPNINVGSEESWRDDSCAFAEGLVTCNDGCYTMRLEGAEQVRRFMLGIRLGCRALYEAISIDATVAGVEDHTI